MTEESQTPVKKRKIIKKTKIDNNEVISANNVNGKKVPLPVVLLISSLLVAFGYFAGVHNKEILSYITPIFGVKTFAGKLDTTSLQKVYQTLNEKYDGKLDTAKLIQGANKGMVEAVGDTYTTYMDASESEEFNKSLSGNIGGGIGAEITTKNNQPSIVRVLKGDPAEAAGLKAGDTIISVNDQSADGWTIDKTVGQIRGEVGTTVKISVKRGEELKDFTITRATISSPSVESSIDNNIGILTISRFDSSTGSDARTAAQEFKDKGVKSIILDLRGNGGGYVEAARQVAGLWLNNKVIVTEKNTSGSVNTPFRTGNNAILQDMPTVVLTNGATASASEILAGALKDYGLAKLVGTNTYGKGCVQELIDLGDGTQLKVTVANWYTPKNTNISNKGIAPDIKAELTQENVDNGVDPQMDAAKKQLNS